MNGKLGFPDGTTHIWNTDRTRVFTTSGSNLISIQQNTQLSYWGTCSGKNRNDVTYSATIAENQKLIFKRSCGPLVRRAVQGVLTLAASNRPTAVLDYGQGACDNTFTITVNGNTYTIN
jgi:hypothetical protein